MPRPSQETLQADHYRLYILLCKTIDDASSPSPAIRARARNRLELLVPRYVEAWCDVLGEPEAHETNGHHEGNGHVAS